ncbi:TolC family protein [Flavivirga aquimarina]|uniref:TolC family protein n=1 Tax=Flavivirga aquimarina TaxID=2027862 RepID=A0ABT8WCP2_9FLAO|nr:TolC family protein [Flavivirga aquimarina]MDO5970837.1 TolC family protein [Flavivirga aquimarina]
MCQKIIGLFVLLLIPFSGISQSTWTLNDCIVYALEHNLAQETQNYNAKISKERWRQSKRDMLPTIGVSYPSYNVRYGRTLDPVTNSFVDTRFVSGLSGGLSSSLTLFESFKKWHTLSYQRLIYESSQFDTQQAEYDLAFKIMDLFNSVLFQEGALEIIKEQQATNLLRKNEIAKKVALSLVAKADLYEIEATTSADALEVLKAENALKAAKLALTQEMNLEEQDITIVQDINMTIPLDDIEPLYIESMYNTALGVLPSLQKNKINVEIAKKDLAIKKTALLPSIYLGASINTSYSDNFTDASGNIIPFNEQIKNNQSKSVGLSLSYPIFGNGRARSNIKIAKIELEKAQTELKIEQQSTYKIVQELLQKNEALIAEEQLNLKKVKAKEKAYDIAKKKYENQLINLYELQSVSNTYLVTKIEQVRLMAQIAIQKRTLDFYNGKFLLPTQTISN